MVLNSAATCSLAMAASFVAMLATMRGTVAQISTIATMMVSGTGRMMRQARLRRGAKLSGPSVTAAVVRSELMVDLSCATRPQAAGLTGPGKGTVNQGGRR